MFTDEMNIEGCPTFTEFANAVILHQVQAKEIEENRERENIYINPLGFQIK